MKELELANDKYVRVTYSAIVAIFMGVAGFAAWMTSMEARTQSTAQTVEEMKSDRELLISIDKRLYSIEELLKRKE